VRIFMGRLIVLHHTVNLFGVQRLGVNLGQGVSFFFVLSGFILTYVYPKLESWQVIKQFWRARIARIWPAYFISFCLGFWLLDYQWDNKIVLADFLMLQAWLPLSSYYFSYNAVAWSVSAEFFFYLVFPVILYNWHKSWLLKLLFSGMVLISLMVLSNFLNLPDYGSPLVGSNGLLISQHGLIYINPLSRIFEFVFGMCVAFTWSRVRVTWSPFIATSYELGVILLCAISMNYMNVIAAWSNQSVLGTSLRLWVIHSGSMFVFGLLIYIMAYGRGKISEMLAHPYLVVLGEISFSLYLVHQILLSYYRKNITEFIQISNPYAFFCFITVLLLISYLMWVFIEMPGRRLLIGKAKLHGTLVMQRSWKDHFALSWKPVLAGVSLISIIGFIQNTNNHPSPLVTKQIDKEFIVLSKGVQSGIHDIEKLKEGYMVSGPDPYVTFALLNPVKSDDASKLVFELKCDTPNNINLQVFWSLVDSGFSEPNSIKFVASQSKIIFNLSSVSSWKQAGLISKIRIDIMPTEQKPCTIFSISNVVIGK
jgi:peptidoglycan/LPS O-acetylase OafA/YrhL